MYLDSAANTALQIKLLAPPATTQPVAVVDYVDLTPTSTAPGVSVTVATGTTLVTVAPAPPAGTMRKISGISVLNEDTAPITVVIGFVSTALGFVDLKSVPLAIGDCLCFGDGSGWYVLDSAGNIKTGNSPGRLIREPQVLTAGTTYTPVAGASKLMVEMVGGGGGGGGASSAATSAAAGGGGGSGAFCSRMYQNVNPATAITYAIGAAGAAGANTGGTGGTGGSTSFTGPGMTITAAGGVGGVGQTAAATLLRSLGGLGGAPTNGHIMRNGEAGSPSERNSGTDAVSGSGGSGPMGTGGIGRTVAGAGAAGNNNGAGGSGGLVLNASALVTGGAGTLGAIRIWEYF